MRFFLAIPYLFLAVCDLVMLSQATTLGARICFSIGTVCFIVVAAFLVTHKEVR